MPGYIAVRNERGAVPKQGWLTWLKRRYTPEAVADFLYQWHESNCDLEMVQRVQNALGMKQLPEHIAKFGKFMLWRARQEVTPEDVVKAYTITVASIQRAAIDAAKLKRTWPESPFTGEVRPEDVWAHLLVSTPEGQLYVKSAANERFEADAARALTRKFAAYGRAWNMKEDVPGVLYLQMAGAPRLAKQAATIHTLLRHGTKQAWTRFVVDTVHGVSYAKAGFLASLLGRGDIPTADAREHDVWAPDLAAGKGRGLTHEYLDFIDERLQTLNVQMPEELRPFYQHLVHHAVWDKTANSETTHREIVKCMAASALEEEIKEFTGDQFGQYAKGAKVVWVNK